MSLAVRHLPVPPPLFAHMVLPRQDASATTTIATTTSSAPPETRPSDWTGPEQPNPDGPPTRDVCGRTLTYEQLPEDPQGRKPVCDGIDPGVLPPGPGEKYCGAGQGYPGVIVFNDKYFTIESVFEPCPNRQATTPSEIGRASSDTTTSTASEQPQQPSAPASNPETVQPVSQPSVTTQPQEPGPTPPAPQPQPPSQADSSSPITDAATPQASAAVPQPSSGSPLTQQTNPNQPSQVVSSPEVTQSPVIGGQGTAAASRQAGGTASPTSVAVSQVVVTSAGRLITTTTPVVATTRRDAGVVQSTGAAVGAASVDGCKARLISAGAIVVSLSLGFLAVA